MSDHFTIHTGDALSVLRTMADESVQCVVTSPPYFGLRSYSGGDLEIGQERTPDEYVAHLVEVFRGLRRVLKDDGCLWLNLGDCYANDDKWGGSTGGKHVQALHGEPIGRGRRHTGLKPKDLIGIPWMVAFALRADGWCLRSEIIWHKVNCMPESVSDRPTKAHEQIFLLTKNERYFYDADAIREPFATDPKENYPARAYITGRGNQDAAIRGNDRGKSGGFPPKSHTAVHQLERSSDSQRVDNPLGRNKRSVWTLATLPTPEAHFATYPISLIEPCILAGCPEGGAVLDPFSGAGTTGLACLKHNRRFVGIELNPAYVRMSYERARKYYPLLLGDAAPEQIRNLSR